MIKIAKAEEMYNQIYKTKKVFDENFQYIIRMKNKDDLRLLEYTKEIKFPMIKVLAIWNPSYLLYSRLEKLLKYSFPDSLKQFYINCSNEHSFIMSDYIEALTHIISKTTNKVYFD